MLSEKPEKQPLEIKGAKDIFEINGKLEDTGRIQYLVFFDLLLVNLCLNPFKDYPLQNVIYGTFLRRCPKRFFEVIFLRLIKKNIYQTR